MIEKQPEYTVVWTEGPYTRVWGRPRRRLFARWFSWLS